MSGKRDLLVEIGTVTPQQALSGLSNKAIVAIGALFVLGPALTSTGLFAGRLPLPRLRADRPADVDLHRHLLPAVDSKAVAVLSTAR